MMSRTEAWRLAKISGEVDINALSARLPRVRFCEVTTATVSPRSERTNSEKCSVDNLNDEAPELDGLVGGLVVEHEVEAANRAFLFEEEKSAQKFFGYGEGGLPYLGGAGLI